MSLEHLLREPGGDPEGALVLSHGRGADERDLHGLFDVLDPERRLLGVSPGAPLTGIPPGGRHWYVVPRVGHPDRDTFHYSYRLLAEFLDSTLAERELAWERTVIGGFSMGAVMSYSVGLGRDRPSPAAIIALSGFVPTVEGWEPALEGRDGLPVLIHHGRLDPVIDVEFGRRARGLLSGAGLAVDYVESDAGHSLPLELVPRLREVVAAAIPPTAGAGSDAPPAGTAPAG